MSNAAKLELLLLAKDKLSPTLERLLKLLKKAEKDGNSSTSVIDKLTKKLERAPKTDGFHKISAEINKTAIAAGAAALAEEKLNKARKGTSADSKSKQDAADKTKLAGATEKAAVAEDKLSRARKKESASGTKIKQETADKTKLAGATEKAAAAEEKLNNTRKRGNSSSNTKQEVADKTKLTSANNDAASSEEKLNNARKRKPVSDGKIKQETADKTKLANATEKAAAAEEKLNNARRRGVRGSNSTNRRPASDSPEPSSRSLRRNKNNSFEDDLVTGGAGAGMLWTSKRGMGAAMSQQEAFTDVYNSFYRSSLSAKEMNGQMEKAEEISIRLGNKLKGNTSDFANMLSTMKQSGMEATMILDGAGEAAAYLAVANREDYSDVGKNYAQFGQLFGVKGKEDNLKIADMMSRAKGKGISSDDLITASKYFGGRTAKTMGLSGAKGAEETLRFMTFIKQNTALDASAVGTGSSAFFRAFTKDEGKKHPIIPEMEKKLGIKLDLFDDKGQFKGLENAVAKFAQMKGKLSDKESLQFGQDLAGDEGAAILSAMINAGATYQQANKDLDEMASMMTKAAKESENLSNKVEALGGSLENLGAAGFGPLVAPLSAVTDKTNEWVGKLTEAAKAQPVFAATTASVLTLGGALLTLKGGSGVLSGIANRIGVVSEAAAVGTSKVGGLRKNLTSLPTMLKIGLTVVVAAEAWEQIQKVRAVVDDWKKMNSGLNDVGAQQYKAQQQEDAVLKEQGKAPDYRERGQNVLSLLQQGNQEFTKALDPSKLGWTEWYSRGIGALMGKDTNFSLYQGKPAWSDVKNDDKYKNRVREVEKLPFNERALGGMFADITDRVRSEMAAVKNLQARVPMLENPNTMTAFRRDALPSLNLSDVKRQFVEQMLQQAFPASFAQSSQQLALGQSQLADQTGQLAQSFSNLQQPSNELGNGFSILNNNSNNTANAVGNLANATNNAAARINSVQITPPTFAPIRIPVFGQSAPPPSLFGNAPIGRAKGGSVEKGHEYRINEVGQEFFTPAQSGSIVSNDILRKSEQTLRLLQSVNLPANNIHSDSSSQSLTVNYEKNISVNKESKPSAANTVLFNSYNLPECANAQSDKYNEIGRKSLNQDVTNSFLAGKKPDNKGVGFNQATVSINQMAEAAHGTANRLNSLSINSPGLAQKRLPEPSVKTTNITNVFSKAESSGREISSISAFNSIKARTGTEYYEPDRLNALPINQPLFAQNKLPASKVNTVRVEVRDKSKSSNREDGFTSSSAVMMENAAQALSNRFNSFVINQPKIAFGRISEPKTNTLPKSKSDSQKSTFTEANYSGNSTPKMTAGLNSLTTNSPIVIQNKLPASKVSTTDRINVRDKAKSNSEENVFTPASSMMAVRNAAQILTNRFNSLVINQPKISPGRIPELNTNAPFVSNADSRKNSFTEANYFDNAISKLRADRLNSSPINPPMVAQGRLTDSSNIKITINADVPGRVKPSGEEISSIAAFNSIRALKGAEYHEPNRFDSFVINQPNLSRGNAPELNATLPRKSNLENNENSLTKATYFDNSVLRMIANRLDSAPINPQVAAQNELPALKLHTGRVDVRNKAKLSGEENVFNSASSMMAMENAAQILTNRFNSFVINQPEISSGRIPESNTSAILPRKIKPEDNESNFTKANYFDNSISKLRDSARFLTDRINKSPIRPSTVPFPVAVYEMPKLLTIGEANRQTEFEKTEKREESIVSANVLRNSNTTVSSAPNITYLTVDMKIDGSNDPKAVALEIKREMAVLAVELREETNSRRMARKVAYEAERDAERT